MPIPLATMERVMFRNKLLLLLFIMMALNSCTLFESNPATVSEYMAWLGDESNGMNKTTNTHGVITKVTYLPPEYLVYQEMQNRGTDAVAVRDSLLAMYSHSRAFLFEFSPDSAKGEGDVFYKGLSTYSEYVERVKTMNFSLNEYVVLESGEHKYKPSFSFFENSYSLDNRRKAVVIFTPGKGEQPFANDVGVVFYDEIFQTGIHRFFFDEKDVKRVPAFPFASLQ